LIARLEYRYYDFTTYGNMTASGGTCFWPAHECQAKLQTVSAGAAVKFRTTAQPAGVNRRPAAADTFRKQPDARRFPDDSRRAPQTKPLARTFGMAESWLDELRGRKPPARILYTGGNRSRIFHLMVAWRGLPIA
jgi:hypothetical protein